MMHSRIQVKSLYVLKEETMKVARIILALLLFTTLLPVSQGFADENSKRAAIEEMLTLMKVDQIIDTMFNQMDSLFRQQFQQLGATEAEQPILDNYSAQVLQVMKEEMAWDKMKEDYIAIYAKVYTEEEITALNQFYQSPVGQKMLAKMPELMKESLGIAQKSMQKVIPRLQALAQEMAGEIRKHKQEGSTAN